MLLTTFTRVLLGDDGYSLTPFLMTPHRNPTTREEQILNRCHSKARITIEQSFGKLKQKFPILRYGARLKLDRVAIYISTCFVLHNIARRLNDPDGFYGEESQNISAVPEVHFNSESYTDLSSRGQERKNSLKNIIATL